MLSQTVHCVVGVVVGVVWGVGEGGGGGGGGWVGGVGGWWGASCPATPYWLPLTLQLNYIPPSVVTLRVLVSDKVCGVVVGLSL